MAETLSTPLPTRSGGVPLAVRIAKSVSIVDKGALHSLAEFHAWFAERGRKVARVHKMPLDELAGWSTDPDTQDIRHHSGKFFSVQGLSVELPGAPIPAWSQPIINQPEIGILGILVKEFNGVLHCLMQAKMEPGNRNGLQLSPTVQATRSNYARVHQGNAVPYLSYFQDTSRHSVMTDALPVRAGLVVLPEAQPEHGRGGRRGHRAARGVHVAHHRSAAPAARDRRPGQHGHPDRAVLSAVLRVPARGATARTGQRTARCPCCGRAARTRAVCTAPATSSAGSPTRGPGTRCATRLVPLREVGNWKRGQYAISHDTGRFFDVMGVHIETDGDREVREWTQPMIAPAGVGIVGLPRQADRGCPARPGACPRRARLSGRRGALAHRHVHPDELRGPAPGGPAGLPGPRAVRPPRAGPLRRRSCPRRAAASTTPRTAISWSSPTSRSPPNWPRTSAGWRSTRWSACSGTATTSTSRPAASSPVCTVSPAHRGTSDPP